MFKSLQNKEFKIIQHFKYYILASIIIVLAGIAMIAVKGFEDGMNIGIDFTGGAKIEIELASFGEEDVVKDKVENMVTKFLNEENGCQTVGSMQVSPSEEGVTYEFRLNYYHNKKLTTDEEEQAFIGFIQGDLKDDTNNGLAGELETKLDEFFTTDADMIAAGAFLEEGAVFSYTVGATASATLVRNAFLALLVAIVAMLIYIVIRFTFSSALAAICALLHDVLVMAALTAIFGISVNSTFIAAIITIVGYSINATIVLFDRIREVSKLESFKSVSDTEIANLCIKKTLTRSIYTTITTLLMVVFLAIMSVSAIREFIIPIIIGLVAGLYSSVFLAPSFWVFFRKLGAKIKARSAAKKVAKRA